ncbi:DUF1642 domain-containing protein [Lactobacillus buchneri]|uniref:hypothetical protein n=1 Tax=Lentilactobacillus buchneri TaxID=1581 RepID=UPI0012929614|nr:hypothetical protein [Lentilactobacillus buchneri]MQM81488.1 DUF1642 domain-containing protein [Lentilactobacillus buchneri]
MIRTYRKTATIKAEQFDYEKWVHMRHDAYPMVFGDTAKDGGMMATNPVIPTLEGDMRVHDGDWIATGVNGEHWPIADDVFRKTYAKLPVISRVWADTIEEYKANHYRLSEIFTEWDLGYGGQEVIARAWLDGYQVEADK